MKKEPVSLSSSISSFIAYNVVIYGICFVAFFFLMGLIAFANFQSENLLLLFFILLFLLKNFATYYALCATRFIKQVSINKSLVIPFTVFDIFFIWLIMRNEPFDMGFIAILTFFLMVSITFSILTLKFFIYIRNMQKSSKMQRSLFVLIKMFCLFIYCISFYCILTDIIKPMSVNAFIGAVLVFLFTVIIAFAENIIAAYLYVFFKLLTDIDIEVKKKLLLGYFIEVLVLTVLFFICLIL